MHYVKTSIKNEEERDIMPTSSGNIVVLQLIQV